jgi:hypothetical protein
MNRAKQYVIGLLCGMGPDHVMMRDVKPDADLARELIAMDGIGKGDLLSHGQNGRSFFEFAETWEALPRLQKILQENGERMDKSDFLRGVVNGKSLLKLAEELNVLNQAFLPDAWAGHSLEMEQIWYSVDKGKREKFDFLSIRRAVAALEGKTVREDELARAGITKDEMRGAVRDGRLDKVRDKLAAVGDTLKAEDFLLMDSYGDNCMDTSTAWNNAQATFDEFNAQNVRFEPWHFLHRCGDKKSVLSMAFESNNKGARHLFNAKIWAGRPEAVMELYSHVPNDKRGEIDLPPLLDEIYNDMYGKVVDVKEPSLQDLLTPLGDDDAVRVLPLGLKAVWDAMPEIRAKLKKEGQVIGIDDLRQTSGILGESCLTQAVRFGKLDEVMAIMADSQAKFTYEDLTAKAENQPETLLQLICKANQQAALLQPRHWIGRGQELLKVWDAMSAAERKTIDFKQIHSEMNRMTLRQRFGGGQALSL